jgi:exodeoxyribonuclease-3
MRIATWNVNSVRLRLDHALEWLRLESPEIVGLQEIKCVEEAFPKEAFAELGYNCAVHGQKGFNGVALLSNYPLEEVRAGLPGDDEDSQSRFLEAIVSIDGGVMRVCSIYLPNGNPTNSEKYPYKVGWMDRLAAFAADRLALEEPLVLAGDFNVIPAPEDVYDPSAWVGDALFRPETRARFRALLDLGLVDAVRAVDDRPGLYTFWDYQAGAWQKNRGLRIDHLLLSPQAADRLQEVRVERGLRARDKPSDHVPVVADLDFAPAHT